MPLYEYSCDSCGGSLEVLQRLSEAPLSKCPLCGGSLHKVISAPALQFKGSGWYVTDYADRGKKKSAALESSSSSSSRPSETKSKDSTPAPPAPTAKAS